jgi:hypothetical protein
MIMGLDIETANKQAYDIVAISPEEFPGLTVLGLDCEKPADKLIRDAVVYATEAKRSWSDHGDNSSGYGKLEAMLQYGLIEQIDVISALHRTRKIQSYTE